MERLVPKPLPVRGRFLPDETLTRSATEPPVMKWRGEYAVLSALCLAIGWFHLWTVRSNGDAWKFGQEQRDYYNLLIDGWLDGQLNLKVEVPAALLAMKNPYDGRQRAPGLALHDASFHHGKYYLYFGAGPVVTLMLPFRVLTGIDLPQPVAVLIFTYGGFLTSVGVWLAIRRRYFPATGTWVAALVVLALGLAQLGPMLLRRTHMWELPIGAAYCFAMLTLFAVFQSLHATRRRLWFAGAGLFLGLAIASRPTYLVALPLLAMPLMVWWREQRRMPWREGVAAVAPLAVIGLLMAWHNYARFAHPLQFGQDYQFTLDYELENQHFSPRYAPFNTWRYFFSVAQWSNYFPFIAPAKVPPMPRGYAGCEDAYGVLANLPLAWFALAAPLALWRRTPQERARLGAWLGAAGVLFVSAAGIVLCFFSSVARYMLEFTPTLVLIGCVGVLAVERSVIEAGRTGWRLPVRLAWGGALVFSCAFAVLFSLQVNGLLAERNPAGARAVARMLNRIPAVWQRLAGARHGAWEMDLRFPAAPAGSTETVLTIGDAPHVDRLWVRYLEGNRVQLGYRRPASPDIVSRPVTVDSSGPHRLRVVHGSLLPPATHPFFAPYTAEETRRGAGLLRIELDGKPLVEAQRHFEPVPATRVRVARHALADGAFPAFTGEVRAARPADMIASELAPGSGEFFRLRLAFPLEAAGRREPLVSIGEAKTGGLVFAEFLAGGRVRFGGWFDGADVGTSDAVDLEPGRIRELVVRMGPSRENGRGQVLVRLDDTIVWSAAGVPWPIKSGPRAMGQNLVADPRTQPTLTARVYSTDSGKLGRDPLWMPGDVVNLSVLLPRDRAGTREPLVVTGRTGQGDLLGIEYLDAEHGRFFFDHWGSPVLNSIPVRLDFANAQEISVQMESLRVTAEAKPRPERAGTLRVKLNGREVWEQPATFYAADPEEIAVGRNPIGGSHAGPRFTGELLLATRGSP